MAPYLLACGLMHARPRQVYWWHEKYRPRKPKYFNRVHTGYEWNKYNQTHYDHDNPPPKVVQGYKFNIFYPDLIDKQVVRSRRRHGRRADMRVMCWHLFVTVVDCLLPGPSENARTSAPWSIAKCGASLRKAGVGSHATSGVGLGLDLGLGAGCGLQAPEYMLERDPNADEHGSTCLLRFTAGPPYEDVYFKILNKEWGARPPLAYSAGEQPLALQGARCGTACRYLTVVKECNASFGAQKHGHFLLSGTIRLLHAMQY